jgi:hypothetical protein
MCCRSAPRSVHRASAIGAGPLQTPDPRWHTQCLGNCESLGNCKSPQTADRRPTDNAHASMPARSCPPGTTAEQYPSTAAPQHPSPPAVQHRTAGPAMPASGRSSRLIWTRQHKRSDKPSPEHPHRLSSRCRAPLVSPPLSDNPIHPGTPPGPLGRFSGHVPRQRHSLATTTMPRLPCPARYRQPIPSPSPFVNL